MISGNVAYLPSAPRSVGQCTFDEVALLAGEFEPERVVPFVLQGHDERRKCPEREGPRVIGCRAVPFFDIDHVAFGVQMVGQCTQPLPPAGRSDVPGSVMVYA